MVANECSRQASACGGSSFVQRLFGPKLLIRGVGLIAKFPDDGEVEF